MTNKFTSERNLSSNQDSLNWDNVCQDIKNKLGKDIFNSWIQKLKLVEDLEHYLVLSSPTRFIRDWITSRYLDEILNIVTKHKKSINRIDFVIQDSLNSKELNKKNIFNNQKDSNVTFIEDSLLNFSRLDENKSFSNFVVGNSNNLAYFTCYYLDNIS